MKLRSAFIFLALFMFAIPEQTHAQFWKKWFKKEERRKPKTIQKHKEKHPETTSKKKRKNLEYPHSKIKSRYRIDVMVPLYLDEIVKNNKVVYKDKLPEKAVTGVNFYEGIKLAADTLTNLGYHVDIFIHDVTQKGLSPEELVQGNVLSESDLLIGALQSSQIPVVAKFAKQNNVNFISVISPSDADIKDNMFFTMLQPTLEKHCERIKEAAFRKYSDQNIFLFYRTNNSVDSVAASYFLSDDEQTFRKVSLNKPLQKNQVKPLFDSTERNVILIPVVDNNYAETVLQQLYSWFPQYKFEVFGMPSWKFINSLRKTDAYPNVGVNFTSPFYYDLTTSSAQALAASYKKQFSGRLGEMTFRGYEVLYWYAYLLQKYGTVYNSRQRDNAAATFTKFDIRPQWNKQQDFLYNENEHLYLYRYQSGSFFINNL